MSTPIRFSLGQGVRDTRPAQHSVNIFAELAATVQSLGESARGMAPPPDGDRLKAWKASAPLWWIAQPFEGDGSRKASNAQPWPLMLLDIDRVTAPNGDHMGLVARLMTTVRGMVPCFGWTTASHTPEAPALRLVLSLDGPVSSEEAALIRDALLAHVANQLGVSVGGDAEASAIFVDPTMQDGAHIAFLPVGNYTTIALHQTVAPLPVGQWLPYARQMQAARPQQQPKRLPMANAPSAALRVVPQTSETVAELRDVLLQLNQRCPTCVHTRRDWIKVLASLRAFGWDDAVMAPIAREWSEQSPKFNADTWGRDWYSLKPDGAVTAATVYWMAGVRRGGHEADVTPFAASAIAAAQSSSGEVVSTVYTLNLPPGRVALPLDTDDGAAQAFIAFMGGRADARAMFTRGAWHVFDGVRWELDGGGHRMAGKLKEFADALFEEAQQRAGEAVRYGDGNTAKAWERRAIVARGLLRERRQTDVLASAATTLYRSDAALDGNKDLLCVPNGAVDLRTGKLLPPSAGHMFSLVAGVPYDPTAECPRFDRFMAEILPDGNVREYELRFLGYCLTGHMREEAMGVWVGTGANGKSALGDVVAKLMGEFACAIDPSLLTDKAPRRGQASPEAAKLMGKRLAYANESREGDRLNDGTLKQLVSTERMTARELYRGAVEFYPTAKVVLRTNHKPEVRDDSEGTWRRLQVVEFVQSFKGREDPHLARDLEAELPGILARLVRGAVEWYRIGLQPPGAVLTAVEDYRKENDVVGQWLEDCTAPAGPGRWTSTAELHESFQREVGRGRLSPVALGRALRARGVGQGRSKAANGFALVLKLGRDGAADTTGYGGSSPLPPPAAEVPPQPLDPFSGAPMPPFGWAPGTRH